MDADNILDRMIGAIGGKTQGDLGKILGISQTSISLAKRKGKVPPEWFLKLSTEKRLNPNWLLTGQGLMHIPERITVDADLLKDVIMAVESFLELAKNHNLGMTQEIKVKWIVAFYEDFLEEKNAGIQRENIEEEIHHKMGRILI
ncbi:helix-turn-helix domain-containing protein [Thiovibrio frasassiensis]|uniref:Helix-turn-helix domain containing protein n=1 Tax=Thiovibrio frasassiensis TaxID=2984131 RepID=A0A9X4MG36_9BACT|nr:helix-turn-helix domain-containing protein [Thiovibrio frasassiensis]MDG4475605.1 helix-turn-helix domain containing protein [Thiovibrio frasassiensis]